MALIKDGKKLNRAIIDGVAGYRNAKLKVHLLACSALWHAAQHGECGYLNKIMSALELGDQTRLRVWAGAAATFQPENDPEARSWLVYKKDDGFRIKPDVGPVKYYLPVRQALDCDILEAGDNFLVPKDKGGDEVTISDETLMKALKALLTKSKRETKAGKVKNLVSPAFAAMVKEVASKAERMLLN